MKAMATNFHGPLESLVSDVHGKSNLDTKQVNTHITNAILSTLKDWRYSIKVMIYPETQRYLGLVNHTLRQVQINPIVPTWAEPSILMHEAVHVYVRQTKNKYIRDYQENELFAECVAFLALHQFGINTTDKSRAYLNHVFFKSPDKILKASDKHWGSILLFAEEIIRNVGPYIIEE